jgi:hypothetical protein
MNAGIGPSKIALAVERLAAVSNDQQITGFRLAQCELGALKPASRPILCLMPW